MSFDRLKGFADLYGAALAPFVRMEQLARQVFPAYGFAEIRPPILEATGLFQRGIGEETDVVQKEMFTFADRKGRSLTMRPEATAGVLRAAIDLGLARQGNIARLFTIGPMFRYERPQKGRQRQFHQVNCECLGSGSPYADAELITMLMQFLDSLGIADLVLHINSLGCRKCRPQYLDRLNKFLAALPEEEFCDDCRRRMHSNPLRVLDCKVCQPKLIGAPSLRESLCKDCIAHFQEVLSLLEASGIAYVIDDRLVRGLDYYARTTFEVTSGQIGAQTAVAGGGRYDGLVAQLGGPDVPGVGFACGMERLALLMSALQEKQLDFYIIGLDAESIARSFVIARDLRLQGFGGEINYEPASMKSLMRQVSRSHARFAIILGPDELKEEKVTIKDMTTGGQSSVGMSSVSKIITQANTQE